MIQTDQVIVWRLGTATLEVLVHDLDGSPAVGAFVWVSGKGSGQGYDVRAVTGADGRVRLPYLLDGERGLYVSIERDGIKVFEESRGVTVAGR